jgi:hemolysin activation/secretion protein
MSTRLLSYLACCLLAVTSALAFEPLDRFKPKEPKPLTKDQEENPENKPSASVTKNSQPGNAQVNLKLRGLIFIGSKPQIRSSGVKAMEGVVVEGVPMLDNSGFTQRIQKFLGQPISMDLVNAIAAETTQYYKEHDHPVVSVVAPPQDVTNGVMQLLVNEARLGEVHVAGNRWFKSSLFHTHLKPGGPIVMSQLEADTAFYGRNPFRTVTAEMAPGKYSGETDVMLHVQDKFPLRVFSGYNNEGVKSTGENQFFFGFNYGNLFGLGQELSYQFTASSDFDQLLSHSATWTVPLPWHDLFQITGTYSESRPKAEDNAPELRGTTWEIGPRYIITLPQTSRFSQELKLGYDFKYTDNNLQFGGTQVFDTPIDISQFSLSYSANLKDNWGATGFNATAYWSPGGMGSNNDNDAFEAARQDSKANYFYAVFGLDRVTKLPLGLTWSLTAKGQLSNGNLQATEQFLLGGESTVRGYPELIAAGDQGILVRNEIFSPSFSLGRLVGIKHRNDQLQFLIFHDYGLASIYQPLPGEDKNTQLQSAGIGARWQVRQNLSAYFDYGWQIDDLGLKDKSRAHFGVTASF